MARTISYREAINEALAQEMARDPSVVVMGEDNAGGAGSPGEEDAWGGVLGVTKGLYHQFPGRVLDTPISESAFIGAAVGAATRGLRPVAELMDAWRAEGALVLDPAPPAGRENALDPALIPGELGSVQADDAGIAFSAVSFQFTTGCTGFISTAHQRPARRDWQLDHFFERVCAEILFTVVLGQLHRDAGI